MTEHPLHDLAMGIRYDLTAAQGKLTELVRQVAEANLPMPEELVCPTCGVPTKGPRTLAEHQHVSHDGSVPDHWLHTEAISAEPDWPYRERRETEAAPNTPFARCNYRGVEGDRCELAADHSGVHEWPTLNQALGGRPPYSDPLEKTDQGGS